MTHCSLHRVLLFLCGLVHLGLLPRDDFNHRSFIDENALMAGLVRREFSDSQSISDYAEQLAGFHDDQWVWPNVAMDTSVISTHAHALREGLLAWLEGSLARIGMEVYSQNYSAVRPAVVGLQSTSVSGRNVYGILRAGRSSSAESLVFSAPSGEVANTHGLAVMMSLAKYFRSKSCSLFSCSLPHTHTLLDGVWCLLQARTTGQRTSFSW